MQLEQIKMYEQTTISLHVHHLTKGWEMLRCVSSKGRHGSKINMIKELQFKLT